MKVLKGKQTNVNTVLIKLRNENCKITSHRERIILVVEEFYEN